MPSGRFVRNFIAAALMFVALATLIAGSMMGLSLRELLTAEAILVVAVLIGVMLGWLLVKAMFLDSGKHRLKLNVMNDSLEGPEKAEHLGIEYELTEEDLLALLMHEYHVRSKAPRRVRIASIIFDLLAAIVLTVALSGEYRPFAIALYSLAVMTILYHLALALLMRKRLEKQAARQGSNLHSLIGRHRISILADEVVDTTEVRESRSPWNAITNIANTRRYTFVIFQNTDPLVLPRRAFPDNNVFSRFVGIINRRYQLRHS